MRRFVRLNAVSRVVLPLAIALGCGDVWAEDPAGVAAAGDVGQTRILVLQDGGVLTGQISREADCYVVTRAGGQIRISASRVLLECDSLEEACNHRRRQLIRPTAEAHLALADWCLRYGLVVPARRELTDARALDATHPRLELLERRLANAEREPRAFSNGAPPRPAIAGAPPRRDEPPGSQIAGLSPQSLAAVSEVPARVVERFTRKVQPVLVNNCTASGCHAAGGAQPFQLDRALLHGLANRRTTMNNLAATLALVDREQPQLSPLLTVPRRTHGGMNDPVFGPRHEQAFGHLVDWVALVTQREPSQPPASVSAEAEPDLLAAEAPAPEPLVSETTRGDAPIRFDDDAARLTPATRQLRFGAQLQRWQPRDPFDPEIFNRQHRAEPGTDGPVESNSGQGDR
jgi:hypothetical protein